MPEAQPISFRNGIYQGQFSQASHAREGFGLAFNTDQHFTVASTWHNNQLNGPTLVYYSHGHFVYGFWEQSQPHGFNACKLGSAVMYAFFHRGKLQGKFLIVFEQYNLAVVLEKHESGQAGQFLQITKGELYSDENLNHYMKLCEWPELDDSWKTLIKFISSHLVHDEPNKTKLQLVNQNYYRYGFDDGLAVIFDDQYNLISAGIHRRANLKSLGIKFTKQNFVQEGNFGNSNQIYAFSHGHRPEVKVGKIYNNFLLKSVQFVNQYIGNPAKNLTRDVKLIVNSNLLRKVLAGQITSRRIDGYSSTNKQLKNESKDRSQSPRKEDESIQMDSSRKLQEQKKIVQEKMRLQIYKKQLYDSINRKNKIIPDKRYQEKSSPIITKPPVEVASRVSKRQKMERVAKTQYPAFMRRSRSPIFTPDDNGNQSRSISPVRVSPFKQKMRAKIFYEDKKTNEEEKVKKYVYQTIEDEIKKNRNPPVDQKNYQSPHEELNYSKQMGGGGQSDVLPLSVRMEQKQLKRRKVEQKQTENNKKQIMEMKKSVNPMSFRDKDIEFDSDKQKNDGLPPNIMMNHPYIKKSPIKTQLTQEDEYKKMETLIYRKNKNNVYLKEPSESINIFKPQKQVKNNATYLQKYTRSKNATPEKSHNNQNIPNLNSTIKSFNANNRVYQIVQSPQKKQIKSTYSQMQDKTPKRQQVLDSTPNKRKYQYVFNQ